MSEKHIPHQEHGQAHEKLVGHEDHERAHNHLKEQAERARQEKSHHNLEKIRHMAEQEAEQTKKIVTETEPDQAADSMLGMQHSLKANAYERTLAKVQQKLPKAARAFSKITHNPIVDKVSNVGSQTIARPSGILGGSISAFLGSLVLLYYSKHYGFRYNYLVLSMLFVGGFLLGAILELLVWGVHSRKQRY